MEAGADIVADVVAGLDGLGLRCALFGGWAEEARGLRLPGLHRDIDLLLLAPDFSVADQVLADEKVRLSEIVAKRFAHKRALSFSGLMVELVLVQSDDGRPCTWFWGDVRYDWFTPLATQGQLRGHGLPVVTRRNLEKFRAAFELTEPWRWKDPASPVGPTDPTRVP